jgi:hypothetical protein
LLDKTFDIEEYKTEPTDFDVLYNHLDGTPNMFETSFRLLGVKSATKVTLVASISYDTFFAFSWKFPRGSLIFRFLGISLLG